MDTKGKLTGRLVAAGRVLAGVSAKDFARVSGLSVAEITMLENSGSAELHTSEEAGALFHTLEHFGIVIVDEDHDMGAGVRLKFTRGDTSQLTRLEGEGGIVASDDAP